MSLTDSVEEAERERARQRISLGLGTDLLDDPTFEHGTITLEHWHRLHDREGA